ncbi:MAG: glycosyltransferase [Bacteroidales bacterium]|nr:glycosyltransferase [Bacteroidales bacterium]
MVNRPKISIVTPSYNSGLYIEEAIQSVLAQEYKNFEHIIIDGGSTDNTLDILIKYPHLIWVSESDEGQSDAINKGFKLAIGEIIGWLNSDDFYLPGTFEVVVHELNNHIVDAIYGNYRDIDSCGNITKEYITQNSSKWMSHYICYIPSTTFFFKRIIIDQGILIDKDFHITMDKEFFAHIFHAGYNIQKVNTFLAHFRWHDGNKSKPSKEILNIRYIEGIKIANRYGRIRFSKNLVGVFLYRSIMILCAVERAFSRYFGIGIYKVSL